MPVVQFLGILVTAAAVALAGPASSGAGREVQPQVVFLDHIGTDGALRLTFGLSRSVGFRQFSLDAPPRIVLDFPALGWRAPAPVARAMPGIAALRHGAFRPGIDRIVIELERPMAVRQVAVTPDSDGTARLVLELGATTPEAFARKAGWPEAARWSLDAAPRPASPDGTGGVIVMLDPGHGGIDPGAEAHGLVEKDLVLGFAHRLAARIDAEPGLSAGLTRDDDRFVPLRERIRMAREAGAALMVSLHADTLVSGNADGASLYTLSERGTDSAVRAFAERENRVDIIAGADLSGTGDDLARVLIALARRDTQAKSEALAEALLAALGPEIALLDPRPHRQGNFFVLKAPDLPSVLLELGFLSSAEDRARLEDPRWQDRMADALTRGIRAWALSAGLVEAAPAGRTGAGD